MKRRSKVKLARIPSRRWLRPVLVELGLNREELLVPPWAPGVPMVAVMQRLELISERKLRRLYFLATGGVFVLSREWMELSVAHHIFTALGLLSPFMFNWFADQFEVIRARITEELDVKNKKAAKRKVPMGQNKYGVRNGTEVAVITEVLGKGATYHELCAAVQKAFPKHGAIGIGNTVRVQLYRLKRRGLKIERGKNGKYKINGVKGKVIPMAPHRRKKLKRAKTNGKTAVAAK